MWQYAEIHMESLHHVSQHANFDEGPESSHQRNIWSVSTHLFIWFQSEF